MDTIFNFGGVEAPKASEYIKPGQYFVASIKSTFVDAVNDKSPYIDTEWFNNAGQSVKRKFYLTVKALPILQYVHEQMVGKSNTNSFQSAKAVGDYYNKLFDAYSKGTVKTRVGMIVGKKIVGDKEYSNLIAFSFLVNTSEDKDFQEREYTVEDFAANRNLTMVDKYTAEQTSETGTILSEMPQMAHAGEVTDDLPF